MTVREASIGRNGDLRGVAFYPLIAAAAIFVVIRFVVAPINISFVERLAVTILALTVEAIPFLLIGSVLSAVIHIYVSEETIARIIPRNTITGVLLASVLGVALPVCDCATVPIVRRLVAKGVPLHVAITFMLAVPMINPLVVFSTWFAFYQYPKFILYRIGFGLAAAIVVGFIISFLKVEKQLRVEKNLEARLAAGHDHHHGHERPHGLFDHLHEVAQHATEDFYDMGRYFIMGVLLSSIVQSLIPQGSLYAIGHGPILSVLVMIGAAYFLSVCSQADAFIARTFMNQFSPGAIVAFLVFGPMIDLKNTLMLSTAFKKRFILFLILLIAVASALSGYLINLNPRGL